MSLVLDSVTVVVRGNFNPYILSPDWLLDQKIWDKDEVHLALGAVSDGVRFESIDGTIKWEADSKRLAVSSLDNAGDLVASVLNQLPHTPVLACGCTIAYSSATWSSPLVPQLGNQKLPDLPREFNPELVKWTGVFHIEDDIRIDMSVACGSEGITVVFGFHKSVSNARQAAETAVRLNEFKATSRSMIKRILSEDVQ